jgi:hypothetical protein
MLTCLLALPASVPPALGSREPVEWQPPEVRGSDVTWEYREHVKGLRSLDYNELRGYHVVLVPGFLVQNYIILKYFPTKHGKNLLGIGGYFGEYVELFEKHGISYSLADIETEETPAANAPIIAKEIRAAEKPVILLGHSKGGVDALHTLIAYPTLQTKVKALVTVQAPFMGTPLVDLVAGDRLLVWLADGFLNFLGGSIGSLHSLESKLSAAWLNEHIDEIVNLEKSLPVLAIATWKDPDQPRNIFKWDTSLISSRDLMNKIGARNDGLVPWQSAVLPGSDFIAFGNADHLVPVMHSDFLPFNRVQFIEAVLGMVLRRDPVSR